MKLTDAERKTVDDNRRLALAALRAARRRYWWAALLPDDDAAQLAYLGLIRAVRSFDPSRGSLATLTYRAVRNVLATEARRWRRWRPQPITQDVEARHDDETPQRVEDRCHARQLVNVALAALPAQARVVMQAVFITGRTERDVARELSCSPQNVSRIVRVALRRMGRTLAGDPPPPAGRFCRTNPRPRGKWRHFRTPAALRRAA